MCVCTSAFAVGDLSVAKSLAELVISRTREQASKHCAVVLVGYADIC